MANVPDAMPSFPEADEIIGAAEIAAGFDRLAAQLQPVVEAGNVALLAVMNGGMIPAVRLADLLHGDFLLDYCHATRYRGATQGAELQWREAPHFDLSGRTVIVVDDIFDAGITLSAVADQCRALGADRVLTAVMLVKDCERDPATPNPDFTTGLCVPDRYVFGCGMDFRSRWRHLRSVYALRNTG
jgi:hypoxanthine phosphoribosyltransferase